MPEASGGMPEALEGNIVVKQGSLQKRGARVGMSWNRRWVTLTNAELAYSYDDKSKKIIDRIHVSDVLDVVTENDAASGNGLNHTLPRQPEDSGASGEQSRNEFTIFTREDGQKEGRKYCFKTDSVREMEDWIKAILEQRDNYTPARLSRLAKAQIAVKGVYNSNLFQFSAAFVIMVNFICNAVEAELNPEPGTRGAEILAQFDLAFIIIFTAELAVNIFANWMQDFVSDAWCWFDTVVVIISFVSKLASDNAGLSVLRTVRAFRVFRLFKKLKELRQIIRAINSSLPAVCNAFFLVILMTMIYAIMGTTFIRFADPENFSAFSVSMYTMWRIMTFDNAAGITLDIMENVTGYDKLLVALFVVSYQLMVAFILCNIVMAVLLEEFSEASAASKSEDAEEQIAILAQRTVSALDPLLHELSQVDTEAALNKQIQELFRFIDEDDSCAVDFKELRSGFRRLDTDQPIDFKEEDFENDVMRRGFANADKEMDDVAFKTFIDVQLKEYVQKQMAKAADEVKAEEKLTVILRSLSQIAFVTSSTRETIDSVVKQVVECKSQIEALQMDIDELNGSDDGHDDNDENLGPSSTDNPENKSRNTLNTVNITGGQISLELEAFTKSQPSMSDLAFHKHTNPGNLALALHPSRLSSTDDSAELEDIQGLNARVDAMQARLLSTIEQAKAVRQKQRLSFSSGVASP